MQAYADPHDPLNGSEHHSGRKCIEPGCDRPAGTAWSPFWCQPCNAVRMDRISASLNRCAFDEHAGTKRTPTPGG